MRFDARLISYINIVLSLMVIFSFLLFARTAMSYFSKEKLATHNQMKIKANKHKKERFKDYAMILKNNAFGFPGGELKLLSQEKSSSPHLASAAGVSLVGTATGTRKTSYAIIENKEGKQDVFHIGDNIFNVGILKSVSRDEVTVNQGGRLIKIAFKEEKKKETLKTLHSMVSHLTKKVDENSYIVDSRKMQQLMENPTQLLTDARIQPRIINGKQEGFVLRWVKRGGIYDKLGFKKGDILLKINDYPFSNPETILQIVTALKGMDKAKVDIIRGNKKITMNYLRR